MVGKRKGMCKGNGNLWVFGFVLYSKPRRDESESDN